MKNILKSLILILGIFAISTDVFATSGIRHYVDDDGNVFLGGNFIEVGISPTGIFGTTAAPKSEYGFHFINGKESNGAYLGLLVDADGWDTGEEPINGDFFTPGNPEERWILSYKIGDQTYQKVVSERNFSYLSGWKSEFTLTDTSNKNTLSAKLVGVTNENVTVTITYSFDVDDLSYSTYVVVKNNNDEDITDVRFVRSFDPDQDQWIYDEYTTYNKVICNPVSTESGSATNYAMVVAKGVKTYSSVFFFSMDNRARTTNEGGFGPSNAYDSVLWESAQVTAKTYGTDEDLLISDNDKNGYVYDDTAIAITTNLGTIKSGSTDSTTYITSLNPSAEDELKKLAEVKTDANINKIVVSDVTKDQCYALFKDGELVKGWICDKEGTITFDGLEDDTTYVISTISVSDYDEDNNKPKSENAASEKTVKTQIDPLGNTDKEKKPTIASTDTSIIIEDANSNYKYKLIDEDGNDVTDYKSPEDGKVVFNNLKANTKYYLVAITNTNEETGIVALSTKSTETTTKKEVVEESPKTDEENPKTSDNVIIYLVLIGVSILSIIGLIIYKKNAKNS